MYCPLCGMRLDEHRHLEDGRILYTCKKGCFEEDHPLIKEPGPGKCFALVYNAGPVME